MIDVLVAGGGPAGAAIATHLARAGVRVVLSDPQPRRWRIGESLPSSVTPFLRRLGVTLPAAIATPAHGTLSVWGGEGLAVSDAVHTPFGPGWTLDRAAFDALLLENARDGGVLFEPSRVEAAPAGLVIDATGRSAAVARLFGATRVFADALTAFYLVLRPSRLGDQDPRVLVEAVPEGWWYTVRVPSGDRVVALLTDPDLVDVHTLRDHLVRTKFVAATLARWDYQPVLGPLGADARSVCLDRLAGPGWLAVGDAAFAVDPLSSQGIADALMTAERGAEAALAMLDGREVADAYTAGIHALYARYSDLRREAYGREQRFPDAVFWRRRNGGGARTSRP